MRRTPVLAPIAAVALCLAACGPAAPMPSPTPTVTVAPAPLFDSDEEALAAAEEVYREYLAVLEQNRSPEATDLVADFVTKEYLEDDRDQRLALVAAGNHLVGSTKLSDFMLQYYDETDVVFYVCHDISGVRVLDSSGADVTPADRPAAGVLLVTMRVQDSSLVISESELWSTSC